MIVLFGGNGFLGCHLRKYLDQRECEVLIVSRQPQSGARGRFERWLSAEAFADAEGERIVAQASAIVYLASKSDPGTFASKPWQEIRENVEPASRFFFKCASLNPSAKIILTSSGGTIYGKVPIGVAIDENVTPSPISEYGLGKLMIEEALRCNARSTGVPYAILRIGNAVGAYQKSLTQGIIPIALRAIRDNRPFKLFGDGMTVRDYVDADNVAAAIYAALKDRVHVDRTWNVGSGIGRSIIDVLELVAEVTGRPVPISKWPQRSVDIPYIVLDCRRIKRDIGWESTIDLSHTVRHAWEFIQKERLDQPTPQPDEFVSSLAASYK